VPRNHSLSRWTVVASLAAISVVIGGSGAVAIGLFIDPMMTELGWSNGLTSSAATAFNLAILLAGPAVGAALDKLGARPVMTFGVLAASTGFLLVSRCHTRYDMLAAFTLTGVGFCASFNIPSAVVVTNWMEDRKSLGMGIIWAATSIGAALFSILIGRWLEAYGWRVASEIIAVLCAMMLFLTVFAIRARPQCSTKTFDRRPAEAIALRSGKESMFSTIYIVATASSVLFAVGMFGVYYHIVPVLIKAGYPTHSAALLFGLSWVLSALGSLVLGVIAERLGAKIVLAGALLSCAIGTLFLLGAGEMKIGVACVTMFIILWGASANCVVQFIPVIFTESFGTQRLGTLIGVQSSIMGIAAAAAPIFTGLLYDRLSDYRLPIYLSASALFLAFWLAVLIPPKRVDGRSAPG
jgi:predicted MFS family arabinose efflux permease